MKPTTSATLPARVDSSTLAKYLQDGEPVIIVKLIGVGNTAPYDFRDKGTRSYIFRFDPTHEGHIIRIPLSLWMAKKGDKKGQMAHDIMDQRHMSHSMVILVEAPATSAISTQQEVLAPAEIASPANTPDAQFTLDCIKATILSYNDRDTANTQESLRECLDRISNAVNGTIEAPVNNLAEKGATDTDSETRNVVGPGAETTVAPASEQEERSTYLTEDEQREAERRYRESLPPTKVTVPSNETQPKDGSQHMLGERRLLEAAYDLVETPKRLKALAALLGVEDAPLREAIGCPLSKIELASAGWVRRKS